ncbi:beta-glucosidase [Deinobacterium chartae]|uniref:Beta-glucosidase n=1 Tax=Deinobacterium chartae TaxID=521158 RepID=A0A841HV75_9DEIO|nr:GH1 family beta-glucosidase [Deinobacterium chartae]MBB6097277.1 beta-glucosidase [Deinobacterium chartae]
MNDLRFPLHFTWGVATSAYQIEGAALEDGRGPSIWDTFCHTPGKIIDGASGDVACEHYHRLEEDLDLIRSLGVSAYRFSVSWPRVQPDGSGEFNERGLAFYDRLVDGLLARGLEAHVTLYHWDLPQALQDAGGWGTRETVQHFVRYAQTVATRLGDRVRSIATLNEPWCSAVLGHETGEHAPGLRDRALSRQVAHHLLLAHGMALQAMRASGVRAELGIVLNLNPAYAASDAPEDLRAATLFDGHFNRFYLDPLLRGHYPADILEDLGADAPRVQPGDLEIIRQPLDFLGINYYSRTLVSASGNARPEDAQYTDMGWEVYPDGLRDLLLRLDREYDLPPVFITENGAAYADRLEGGRVRDPERVAYLRAHLAAVRSALEAGVKVKGYFAWSLMDNFEWAWGYTKRFGLVYVDYATQRRVVKESGEWYGSLVRGLEPVG